MLDFGILGNNARNLLYIKKFNDKKSIRLANNKLQTKNFLGERGIPFAKTYAVIKNRKELFKFDFSLLPKKSFVVKPNKGSKGGGVYVVKYLGENGEKPTITKKKSLIHKIWDNLKGMSGYQENNHEYQIGDNIISDNELRRYMVDILDGQYSMTTGNDKIIVEEKLNAGEGFKEFCEHGLADIRIIVFNLVPVAAMIRVPTEASGGTANLAKGGLGFGIQVGTGKIKTMLWKRRTLKKNFPQQYKEFYDKKIPYRNDLLALSSKIQFFVNLGYLALDWVITNDGPKLLEINARAGLEVQNIANVKLKKTLEKIIDMKIDYPEKGVEIAKTLFTPEKAEIDQKVLYLSQYGKLQIEGEEEKSHDVIVEIDLNKNENYLSNNIHSELKEKQKTSLNLYENDIIFKNIKYKPSTAITDNKIVLGKKAIDKYLIKATHKIFDTVDIIDSKKLLQKEKEQLHLIDQKITKIGKKINISNILKPKNYIAELDTFISKNGKYNPTFEYNRPSEERLQHLQNEIKQTQENIVKSGLKSPFLEIFKEKLEFLQQKIQLIMAYKNEDFEKIEEYNKKLFGDFDEKLVELSKEKIIETDKNEFDKLGRLLTLQETLDYIKNYLIQKKISGIDVVLSYNNISRISMVNGKEAKILVSKVDTFREKELEIVLAHEVDTHLIRHINGLKSGRDILKNGTGYYLKDEEGLAIYNEEKIAKKYNYEKTGAYKEYFLVNEAKNHSFAKLVNLIGFLYPHRPIERIFKIAIRTKKGLINTERTGIGTAFIKDKVYLEGYVKIKERIEKGGNEEDLYKGKIKIEDLEFIK